MKIKAYAKINLGLDVLGRLPGGYHEVKMVMQTVGIYDELELEKTERGITIVTDCGELPTDENNLIYKACRIIFDRFRPEGGVKISLQKNIPIAAGMAGGSTDAASTMKGLCRLFDWQISDEALREMGVKIGADIPYCIMGGTALAEGIGERLTRLPDAPQCTLLVAKPDIHVSTKEVYEALDCVPDYPHPDIDGMTEAIRERSLQGIVERLGNALESVTVSKYPVIDRIKETMLLNGAKGSLMSGSGPTVFGIFETEEAAHRAEEVIRRNELARQIFVTQFIPADHQSNNPFVCSAT